MADPVIAVILYAVTRGILSLEGYNTSSRWQAQARMRLRAAKREMDAKVAEVESNRLFAEMAIKGLSESKVREAATLAQQRFTAAIKPWLRLGVENPADDLDLEASWYIMYQPEQLKALGVDFGHIKPVSE